VLQKQHHVMHISVVKGTKQGEIVHKQHANVFKPII